MLSAPQCLYGFSNERGDGMGRMGMKFLEERGEVESGDSLTSCMQMTWFFVLSQKNTLM